MISLEKPQWKWASSRLEGKTSWIFSSCGRSPRLTTGTSGTRSGGHRKGQSPCEFLRGLSGFLSLGCPGLRPCVESGRNLGFLSSADMDLWVFLESPQGSQSSCRIRACTCASLQSGSSSVMQSAAWIKGSMVFPRVFPTGLSHVRTCRESILGLNVKAVQGKQLPLEWTDTSGGLLEWWHDPEFLSPFLWRAPPLEMRRERREFFP